MKNCWLLFAIVVALATPLRGVDEYSLGPDSQRQPGVPQGTVTKYSWTSKIFPGTVRDYWVYVPAQYVAEKPACGMVFQDGKSYVSEDGRARIPIVFDNLIAKHDMPVTIAILIDPGVLKAASPGQQDRINRSYEYDGLSDRYAQFLLTEILPEVAKHYSLSTNPNDRAISGGSSGGICSFTVAWSHPEAFHRVLSFISSYTDLRGGDIDPALIRKTEPKPLRVFLQDGNHDLNVFAGDWWLANQSMASALTYAGYDVKFVTGDKDHDMIQGGAIMPDALRWLWRDYPQPIAKPPMRAQGDQKTGFAGVDSEWEEVATLGSDRSTKTPASLLLLNEKLRDARGIAVDDQGNVFIGDSFGKAIHRIDLEGHDSTFMKDVEGARSLALGPDGLLYGCGDEGIVSYSSGGTGSVRIGGVRCQDIAITRDSGLLFTGDGGVASVPLGNLHHWNHYGPGSDEGLRSFVANGICLPPDQSMLYVSDPNGKWVWSYQVQSDGSLANGEPFFRTETSDEASASGAAGMATDSQGLLYVATLLGIQICDQQGRVVAILSRPKQADPSLGPVSGIALGGPDHQYLYAVIGNKVFRRHLVRRGGL
jgi:gluconolactonase